MQKILQKFAYNYSVAPVLLPFTYICPKKISNFSLEHLFTFCTRQSTARTTIAAIVRRAIIRNIEWSKYKREVSAKGWLCPLPSPPPFLHYTCTHIPAVSRRSSFCRGIIGLYELDKNTRQRQKSHTSHGLCMHSLTCTCVYPYTYARHLASVSHSRDFSGVVSARRYRWASFVDG